MISLSRPYSKTQFNQSQTTRQEINNSCEFIPESSMICYQNLQLTDFIIEQGKILSFLLSSLATQVFNLPIQTIHLFRDDIHSGMYKRER